MIDWKAFLLVFAIVCIIFLVAKWAGNRFDRWWIKTIEMDKEKEDKK